jgi:hypothetical protein
MKKLIAISVMLALIVGAAFAETKVSGYVETRFQIGGTGNKTADGSGGWETPDPRMGGQVANAYLQLSGQNDDGTLGGIFRLRNEDIVRAAPWFHKAFVWWKPIDQVKISLGIEQDGLFDTADFLGWGFHKGDNDYLFNHHWDLWRQIFPGNWDGFGLAFSFYLVDGLDINLALETGGVNWPQASNAQVGKDEPITDSKAAKDGNYSDGVLPGRLLLTANYSLDFGKISFVYKGAGITNEKGSVVGFDIEGDNGGTVGASVLITAIDGIQIKAGGSIILNNNLDKLINAGLGATWQGEGFGVNARFGYITQGEKNSTGEAHNFITVNVMPFFNVGSGQVLVDVGITNDSKKATNYKGDETHLGWSVTPIYRLPIDGGAFKVGLQLFSNVKMGGNVEITGQEYVKWSIPMSLSFGF